RLSPLLPPPLLFHILSLSLSLSPAHTSWCSAKFSCWRVLIDLVVFTRFHLASCLFNKTAVGVGPLLELSDPHLSVWACDATLSSSLFPLSFFLSVALDFCYLFF